MPLPVTVMTERIDDIVLLLHVMMQMSLPQLLNEHLPHHWKQKGLSWGWVIVIWLSYVLSAGDHRKVVVREWVNQRRQMLEQVCGLEISDTDFSDDRLSIVLKHLSDGSNWQSIETTLNRRLIRGYALPTGTMRLDATTVSGEHMVSESGLFQFGHSKDDPSLAQIKVMMASLDPLGMPLATLAVSGEQADDGLYIPAFEQARASLATTPLLWVGDCKMGAIATRAHIHHHGHAYLMPLARIGKVPELLAQWLSEQQAAEHPLETVTLHNAKGDISRQIEGYCLTRGVEGKTPDGHPVCWQEQVFLVHSETHHRKQQQGLAKRLQTATAKLFKVTPAVGRGRKQLTTASELRSKAAAILKSHRVTGLLEYSFQLETATQRRKARYQITAVRPDEAAIEQQQRTFGWRVYVSNTSAENLSFEQAVLTYREEWIVEHGFHRFKGKSLNAHPLFVKRDDQVQGLTHFLSLGLRLLTLIEFVVHRQLVKQKEALPGLYLENAQRTTTKPRTERLLKVFKNITLTCFEMAEKSYRHLPPLTPIQEKILQLLGFSPRIYTDLLERPG